jgi:uncharacterized protein (DUF1330 family)
MTKKYYTIIVYKSITDAEALAKYAKLAIPLIAQYGGKVLAGGMPLSTLEDSVPLPVTLLEWDHPDSAHTMYNSPSYQAALAHFDGKVSRDVRFIEGR